MLNFIIGLLATAGVLFITITIVKTYDDIISKDCYEKTKNLSCYGDYK